MDKTPAGIAVLGIISIMAGIAHVFAGLTLTGYVAFWDGELGSGLFLWGVLNLVIGVAFMACAVALWSTASWAWVFANFVAVFALVDAVFVLFSTHELAYGIGVALLPIVVLWYLNQPHIKAAFRVEDRTA